MRLGIMVEGQEGVTWERWLRIMSVAEQWGFESLWRSDHLFSVLGAFERETLALWPSLTAVALQSQRLIFGQLVSPVSFRHPVELAQHAVALDTISNGRYVLGIGAGWYEREHQAFGFPLLSLRERMDRLAESLQVIRLLWTGDVVSFDGRYYQLQDAQLLPRPTRGRVPIVIGGRGERRTLALAAQFADEWNVTNVSLDEHRHKIERLREHCRIQGRDPERISLSWMVAHIVGQNEAELLERARRMQTFFPGLRNLSAQEALAQFRQRGWLVGTPEEILAQLRARKQLGVERVMLQTFDLDDSDALRLMAEQILPELGD